MEHRCGGGNYDGASLWLAKPGPGIGVLTVVTVSWENSFVVITSRAAGGDHMVLTPPDLDADARWICAGRIRPDPAAGMRTPATSARLGPSRR